MSSLRESGLLWDQLTCPNCGAACRSDGLGRQCESRTCGIFIRECKDDRPLSEWQEECFAILNDRDNWLSWTDDPSELW